MRLLLASYGESAAMIISLPKCPEAPALIPLDKIPGGTVIRTQGGEVNNRDNLFLVCRGHGLVRLVDGAYIAPDTHEAELAKFIVVDADLKIIGDSMG